MANEKLWTTIPKREDVIRAIRNDLIERLDNNTLKYGELTHAEIASIIRATQPSVSRLLKHGKNTSKPVAVS